MEQNIIHRDGTTANIRQKAAASGITKMEQSRAFMGDDKLTIEVVAAQPMDFRIGDTINVHGQPYKLNRLPTARKEGERRYTYSIMLEGVQFELITAQFLLFDNITDDVVANPSQYTLDGMMMSSLTGTAGDILKMIVLNANRVHGDGTWAVGTFPQNTDTINFSLEDGTCLEALQALAEEWELEWRISTDTATGTHTINLTAEPAEVPEPLTTFSYGKTGGLYSVERSAKQGDIVTRLYAYGGTQNIPTSYLTEANTSRLCIKNGNQRKQHLSYVENATLKQQYGLREKVESFDDIYPQRVGTVTGIYTTGNKFWCKFRDTNMFDLNARDPETGETLYLIAGATAKITFQTGQMTGYTFEIVEWNDSARRFTIKEYKEEGDLLLPSETVSNLRIAVGDKYILTDINLPQVYITDAENQLKQKATKTLQQLNADIYQYTIQLDSRYVKNHASEWGRTADNPFDTGDYIAITDSELNITTTLRLTAYTRDLINDTYTLTVQLYQPRIKTTQTTHRRWRISRLWERISRQDVINSQFTADEAHELATDGMEEIVAGRGSYSSLNGRMTAINTTATNAGTAAGNAMSRANAAYVEADLLRRFVNNNNFSDRHIDKLPTFESGKLTIEQGAIITDTLAKIQNGFAVNQWTTPNAEIDFSSGEYDSGKAYDVYAVIKEDGTVEEIKPLVEGEEGADNTYILLGSVSAEDGNGERTYTPNIAQAYMEAGVMKDSGGNAVLDIEGKTLLGTTKIVGLRNAQNNADLDLVALLGALPTTAGGLRKILATAVAEIGDETTADTILYRTANLEGYVGEDDQDPGGLLYRASQLEGRANTHYGKINELISSIFSANEILVSIQNNFNTVLGKLKDNRIITQTEETNLSLGIKECHWNPLQQTEQCSANPSSIGIPNRLTS